MFIQKVGLSIFVVFCVIFVNMTHAAKWEVEYNCDVRPEKAGWEITEVEDGCGESEIENGTLFWDSTDCARHFYFYEEWDMNVEKGVVVEARFRVEEAEWVGDGGSGVKIGIGLGANPEYVNFLENGVCFNNSHSFIKFAQVPAFEMDTTDQFHTYRIIMVDDDIWVWLADNPNDPKLLLNGEDLCKSGYDWNEIHFGDSVTGSAGSAYWDFVRYTSGIEVPPPSSVAPEGKLAITWGELRLLVSYHKPK